MATRPIVPRGDGEGSIGTSEKKWAALWAKKLNNVDVDDLIANKDDYRQPNTAYTAGTIKYHHSLPTGYYLECTTPGTTSSGDLSSSSTTIGDTVTDGTVTWTICKEIGTGNAPIYAGYNQKQTFTSSGSFAAPVSATYKITLQGAGGGGGGAGTSNNAKGTGGSGGGGGGLEFYEKLTAGTNYNFTVGAGGTGGAAGSSSANGAAGTAGGASSITIGDNAYVATGGGGGGGYDRFQGTPGGAGIGTINSVTVPGSAAASGATGYTQPSTGVETTWTLGAAGRKGWGYGGQSGRTVSGGSFTAGSSGGNGYITFEWLDPTLL